MLTRRGWALVVLYSIVYGSYVRYSLITIIVVMGSYYVWMQCECIIIGSWHRDACMSRYVAHTCEYDRHNRHHSQTYSMHIWHGNYFLLPPQRWDEAHATRNFALLAKIVVCKYSAMAALDDICHERNIPPWLYINLPNLTFATNLMLD